MSICLKQYNINFKSVHIDWHVYNWLPLVSGEVYRKITLKTIYRIDWRTIKPKYECKIII